MLKNVLVMRETYRDELEELNAQLNMVFDIKNTCKVVFDNRFNVTDKFDLAQIRNANLKRCEIRRKLIKLCKELKNNGKLNILIDYTNLEKLYNDYISTTELNYIIKEA